MEDSYCGGTGCDRLLDQSDNSLGIECVKRGCWLVEQKHGTWLDHASRNIDALLLASRKSGRSKSPKPFGHT
jgi:hypothetical protein